MGHEISDAEFAAAVELAERTVAKGEAEIRQLRRDRVGCGAISAVKWQMREWEEWLWEMRFRIWDLREGTADRERYERIAERRVVVPF